MSRGLPVLLVLLLTTACTPGPHQLVIDGNLEELKARIAADPASKEALDDLGKTPLHKAITFQRTAVFEFLLEAGANLEARDVTGMRPLHVAAALNRSDYARQLVAAGADPETIDTFGDTPLHTAAMFGAAKVIEVLVYEGANVFAVNNEGLTPADLARKHRRTMLADRLETYMEQRPGITGW